MNLIVLSENKQAYQPSELEIIDYGQYLGLKFPQDDKFKPFVRQALLASLPEGWQACETDDDKHDLVYRNTKTNQIINYHPLDDFFKMQVQRMKAISQNLPISTIFQERQSWLKDSSEMYGPSRDSRESPDYSVKHQGFINQISEEKSMYDEDEQSEFETNEKLNNDKKIIIKATKTPRVYRRKKDSMKLQQIQERLINMNVIPQISMSNIKSKKYPALATAQQNQKLKSIIVLNQKLQQKRDKVAAMEKQRIKKLQYMQALKRELQLLQS